MKEAAGEANMTVITIVLIAIVLAVGTVIVTNLMNKTADKTNADIGACGSGYTLNETTGKCEKTAAQPK